ncbi:hypothetical protein BDW22DRAFT_1356883 [Trametopsis cervina]|nr:hypothetical protein BDW22DRAFT_1356883 [Trametopsis cervina]
MSNNLHPTHLIPNRNISHPSLAPVDVDALRQSLLRPAAESVEAEAIQASSSSLSPPSASSDARPASNIQEICTNKVCNRIREDTTKKWCERCRARQQRKVSRQRMKAKLKKEVARKSPSTSGRDHAPDVPRSTHGEQEASEGEVDAVQMSNRMSATSSNFDVDPRLARPFVAHQAAVPHGHHVRSAGEVHDDS